MTTGSRVLTAAAAKLHELGLRERAREVSRNAGRLGLAELLYSLAKREGWPNPVSVAGGALAQRVLREGRP